MADMPLTDEDKNDPHVVVSQVVRMMEECEDYNNALADDRQKYLEYYEGVMDDVAPDEGRSQAVSKDLRAVVRKLMPSIMRTMFSGHKFVEYEAMSPDQEAQAKQATQYINKVVMPDCNGADALYDAIFDAIVLRTGILKWYASPNDVTAVHEYTGYGIDEFEQLSQQENVEILEAEQQPDGTVDFMARVNENSVKIVLEATPRSSFLIHPHEKEINKNMMVGERTYRTRSELVEMGYDKAMVDSLQAVAQNEYDEEDQYFQHDFNREFLQHSGADSNFAMEEILVYDLYVRLDMDGDGIAELYNVVLAQGNSEHAVTDHDGALGWNVLDVEEVDEAPYSRVVIERRAHTFDGYALSDDMESIQRVKTVLLRETLDNIYWQNTPQPAVDRSKVEDINAVVNPVFGRPIFLKPGANVRDALQFTDVPFVGDKTLEMMDYMDRLAKERTGITDMAGGVDPSKFQEMSATGASIVSETGTQQAEMIVRTLAMGGIRDAFLGLLRLVVAHSDRPHTMRFGEEWQTFDPRHWDAEMSCTVNVGLGAGTKERDLQALSLVRSIQTELVGAMGPNNPFVDPNRIYNLIEKMVEASGLPSADAFFRRPTEEDVQQMLEQEQEPDPEVVAEQEKMQAQLQMKQQEMQLKFELEVAKAERQSHIEMAQMEADQQVEAAKLHSQSTYDAVKNVHAQQLEAAKAESARRLEQMKLDHDEEMKRLQARVDLAKHNDQMDAKEVEMILQDEQSRRQEESKESTDGA